MRILACALALITLLSGAARAVTRAVGYWGDTPVFSVEYDERVYSLDDDTYLFENDSTYRWQFIIYDSELWIDCGVEYYDQYNQLRFFDMENRELWAYMDELTNMWTRYRCAYLDTLRVEVKNGEQTASIPFLIMSLTYADGAKSYYAETISNGYTFFFEVFREDEEAPGKTELEALKSVLNSFLPISK